MVSEKNRLRVLDDADLEAIHGATMAVLAKVGVRVESEDALKLLERNGYVVDMKAKLAKMDESSVTEAVKSCARDFRWHAPNERYSCDVVDGRTKFGPGSQCLSMMDPGAESVRPTTLKDSIAIVKLMDALDSCSFGGVPVYPHDVPVDQMSAVMWIVGLANSSKLSFGGWGDDFEFELMLRIADIIMGDRELLRKKVMFPAYIDPISPLAHDANMVQTLIKHCEWNSPVFVMAMALAGGTAPVTLAGLLVQQNAEILSAVAIAKCVTKNPKIVYGSVSCPLDMRSGISATGSPEFSLLGVGAVQLAKHYGLPSDMGVQSDSKTVDSQTAYEKTQATLMAILAKADTAELSLGSTEAFSTFSLVQLLIDDEITSNIMRIAQGIDVNEETLSVDVIAKTGPMGNYLKHPQTMKLFRKEHSMAKLSDRATRQQWMAVGSKDVRQRARDRANHLLVAHTPEPLEPEVRKGFDALLRDYAKGYDLRQLTEIHGKI
jgi:trimethylamine--corrinoid protein Co-methyltransferase